MYHCFSKSVIFQHATSPTFGTICNLLSGILVCMFLTRLLGCSYSVPFAGISGYVSTNELTHNTSLMRNVIVIPLFS